MMEIIQFYRSSGSGLALRYALHKKSETIVGGGQYRNAVASGRKSPYKNIVCARLTRRYRVTVLTSLQVWNLTFCAEPLQRKEVQIFLLPSELLIRFS